MKGRGIVIWLIGIGLLGLMAAYLFTQSRRNKQELEQQASRNMLLVRENLKESLDALQVEIEGFIGYKLVLLSNDEKKKRAADSLPRDMNKFIFTLQDKYNPADFSYEDKLRLSGIAFDSIYLKTFRDIEGKEEVLPDNQSLNLWIDSLGNKATERFLSASLSFQQWMDGGLRKSSFFDVVFLANEKGEFLYPSTLNGSKVPFPGESMKDSFSNSDVSHFEMKLSAATYEGYISPLQIGDEILWVGGLKNQEDINLVAYSIDYNLLVTIAVFLVVLLLSLPLISYFDMGKGDVLSKRRVYLLGVSLLMIFMVSGFILSFLIFQPDPIKMEEKRAYEVRSELLTHFQLIQENVLGIEKPNSEGFKSTLGINEKIKADDKGVLKSLRKGLAKEVDGELDFSFIDINHRNYFKYFFDTSLDPNRRYEKYFIERIFSQKDGKPELVMSAKKDNSTALSAITFTFTDTLINTNNKGYVLFKEDGEVLFASEKFEIIFTHIKTALPDKKWKEPQTLIQSNKYVDGEFFRLPLYLNGKKYTALISKFGIQETDNPIWYVYLVNTNMYHSLTGMMVVESTIWLAFYVVLLIFISLAKAVLRRSRGYNWENFVYSGFHPKKIALYNIKFGGILLIILLLLIFLVFLIVKNKNHFYYSVLFFILIALFFAFFNHFFLPNRSKYTERITTRPYSRALFLWLFLIGFMPAFIISASVFQYETKLWNKIEANNTEKRKVEFVATSSKDLDTESDFLYRCRAGIFSAMDKGFDAQLRELIFPNRNQFSESVGNIYDNELPQIPNNSVLLLLLLFFLILGFGIYLLIKKLVRTIYWTDFNIKGNNLLGPFIKHKLRNSLDMRIFLCGCDSRKNKDWIHNYLQINSTDLEILDCAVMELKKPLANLKQQNKKGLLIENIHCIADINDFLQELPRFLNSAKGIHLIISSGISWRKLANQLQHVTDKIRFSQVISDFYFEIVPITFQLQGVKKNLNVFNEKAIKNYLINNSLFAKKDDSSNLCLLLQRYGKAYFYNIWAELSIEEKSVCYCYSKEGFFNFQNKEEIIELFQKGIIVKDEYGGQLRLFSKTFRYFVNSIVAEQELGKLAAYRKKNENALNTQWALLSFLLVAFGLLSYFDRSFLTELQAIVTGVTGITTLIIGEIRRIWITKPS